MTGRQQAGVASRIRHVENRHRLSGTDVYQQGNASAGNHANMAEITIVYWRDIPAQVIVGKGRRGSKVQLTERFEQAIDRCAMKIGAKDADAYLAEWRKVVVAELEGEPDTIATDYAAKLEVEFDTARLKTLIDAEGWAKA
jgi:Virulence factor